MLRNATLFLALAFLGLLASHCLPFSHLAMAETSAIATGEKLRWKFPPGQVMKITMNQDMTQNMNIHGQEIASTNKTATWMTWKIKGVDEKGIATITTMIDRLTMAMDSPMGGKIEIDTNKETDPEGMAQQLGKSIRPMIGVEFTQTMNDRGEVLDVKIPDEALKGFQPGTPAGNMMTPETMTTMMKNATPAFPEEEVEPGSSWKHQSSMKLPIGKMNLNNTYTYRGTDTIDGKELHRIGVEIAMQFEADNNAMGATIDVSEQETDGTLWFDTDAGHISSADVTQNTTMDIKIGDQQIQQKMKQKTITIFEVVK